ncbi:Relaxase/Mobilization nuclease domain protein [Caprobacter fermentans]|uniref:Relaxase/Mobilization nuclease domain protein n=1 Tax=Caproicibacter fermentans TaxID=2576756 RepID=A0A6N8HZS6_9FIRM|nr:relaxase/mobilization nuclease domain-containing protein [Caproicibacter fermentans]MVB10823.1 Relaxase/Mobilization nuclease domain protein [Caproicibacter fermentans]
MATTFITGIAVRPGRSSLQTAYDSISYITNPRKTRNGELVSAFRCSPNSAPFEIMYDQHMYEQETGRKVIVKYTDGRKSYLLMTMRQSFAPGEVTPEQALELGRELADRFLKGKYQYVIATHIDKAHIHNHIIYNIVGSDKKKFRQTEYTPQQLRDLSDRICKEHGLSVVIPTEWQKRKFTNEKVTSYRTVLKNDIDRCIRAAQDYEDFLRRMREQYYVDETGKYLRFRHRTNGQQRMIRSYTLGKGYTRQEIRMRAEMEEELINPATFSQKLRNIEAMIHAAGYVRENGTDFDRQSEQLKELMEQTQKKMDEMRDKLTRIESIAKCFDALEQYGSVYSQYQSGQMFPQEVLEHQTEIGLYQSARATLKENHIGAGVEERNRFRSELARIREDAAKLEDQYRATVRQLNRVEEVREISERVEADDPIIARKKGGKQYGR